MTLCAVDSAAEMTYLIFVVNVTALKKELVVFAVNSAADISFVLTFQRG